MKFKDVILESDNVLMDNGKPLVANHYNRFGSFDKNNGNSGSILGKGIYLSLGKPWSTSGTKGTLKYYNIKSKQLLDMTKPLEQKDADILSKLLGRPIDKLRGMPIISVEKIGNGSLLDGLSKAGYDAVIHYGRSDQKDKHIAVLSPSQLIEVKNINENVSWTPPQRVLVRRHKKHTMFIKIMNQYSLEKN